MYVSKESGSKVKTKNTFLFYIVFIYIEHIGQICFWGLFFDCFFMNFRHVYKIMQRNTMELKRIFDKILAVEPDY